MARTSDCRTVHAPVLPGACAGRQCRPALVCDTQEQVERFVAVFRGDAQSAAKAVNTEVKDPNACEVIPAAYVWGREVATVRTDLRSYHIVRILVFGIMTQDGDILASTPTPFFSYVEVDERGA